MHIFRASGILDITNSIQRHQFPEFRTYGRLPMGVL